MIGLKFNSLFKPQPVLDAAERARRKNLAYAGAYLRKVARNSLKVAKQKTDTELSAKEQQILAIRRRKAAEQGLPMPKRPLAHSRPGEPPRLRKSGSSLKAMIRFAYEAANRTEVIGPQLKKPFNPTVPQLLEHGGKAQHGEVEPRPFMEPALQKTLPQFRDIWRDSVRA